MKRIKKPNMTISNNEYIRINKMLSRQEEINKYGKSISYFHVFESKKSYSRKGKKKFNFNNIDY